MRFANDSLVELHVPDFQTAYDFYKILGFELAWMEEDYMVMRRGQSVLAFYGGTPDVAARHSYFSRFAGAPKRGYGVEIVIFVDGIEELYHSLEGKTAMAAPLQRRPWGRLDFRLEDPFGFYLRVSERYNPAHQPRKQRETADVARRLGLRL